MSETQQEQPYTGPVRLEQHQRALLIARLSSYPDQIAQQLCAMLSQLPPAQPQGEIAGDLEEKVTKIAGGKKNA